MAPGMDASPRKTRRPRCRRCFSWTQVVNDLPITLDEVTVAPFGKDWAIQITLGPNPSCRPVQIAQ